MRERHDGKVNGGCAVWAVVVSGGGEWRRVEHLSMGACTVVVVSLCTRHVVWPPAGSTAAWPQEDLAKDSGCSVARHREVHTRHAAALLAPSDPAHSLVILLHVGIRDEMCRGMHVAVAAQPFTASHTVSHPSIAARQAKQQQHVAMPKD
jgi:hypothetical protein